MRGDRGVGDSAIVKITGTAIPGCFEVQPRIVEDARGRFVKVVDPVAYAAHGLETGFVEEYYSRSGRSVLRGLHFQLPPHDHVKLVYCVSGEVLDAVVDLREGSPMFGRHVLVRVSAAQGNALYLPRGVAHGFYVTSAESTMIYNVTTGYAPASDSGIRWNSAGIEWPDRMPVLSPRDAGFVDLAEFRSPFRFEPEDTASATE